MMSGNSPSDQYRSSTLFTKKGVSLTGLAAPQGDIVTVLQSDGTKVTLKKDEIEQQISRIEAGIESLRHARGRLARYRASVLKAACDGRLVPTEAELARAGFPARLQEKKVCHHRCRLFRIPHRKGGVASALEYLTTQAKAR